MYEQPVGDSNLVVSRRHVALDFVMVLVAFARLPFTVLQGHGVKSIGR